MPPSTYYVVKFLAPPRPDVDKYVCVPDTWIRWTDPSTSTVGVAYPEGNPARIEHMAKMNQDDPNYWVAYNSSIIYCMSSYEQAMSCLRILREIASSTTASSVPISKRRFSEGPPGSRPTARTSYSGGIGANNKAYRRRWPLLVNVSTQAPMPQTKPQQMMQSSAGTAKHSSISGTQYPVHDDHPNRSLQASLESRPMSVPRHNNPSTSVRDVQATQNASHGCRRPGTSSDHACCATQFKAVLDGVKANVQKLQTEFSYWATRHAEKLEEVGVWMKENQVWKRSVESQLSERPPMSEMPRKIKAEVILIEDNDDDHVNHGNSTIPNLVMTTRVLRRAQGMRMAQFTLPPEYKQNDSRWTLRYRYPRLTLTELIPNSRIYVDSKNLADYLATASDCKSLARLLMMEVFSDNALRVCSFTGAKNRCPIYSPNSPDRPGLDKHARNILVKYVEKCGRHKGWRIPDVQTINKSMRGKLEGCRQKARNGN